MGKFTQLIWVIIGYLPNKWSHVNTTFSLYNSHLLGLVEFWCAWYISDTPGAAYTVDAVDDVTSSTQVGRHLPCQVHHRLVNERRCDVPNFWGRPCNIENRDIALKNTFMGLFFPVLFLIYLVDTVETQQKEFSFTCKMLSPVIHFH